MTATVSVMPSFVLSGLAGGQNAGAVLAAAVTSERT
jgi:hypothetical protein